MPDVFIFFGVLGLVAALIGGLWWYGREAAVLARLARRHGLTVAGRAVTGPGLTVWLTTEGSGKSQTTYLNYRAELPGCPSQLTLMREGAESGKRYHAGSQELTTGDVDFDDLIWVESRAPGVVLEYLNETRRHCFVELLFRMPHATVSDSHVHGRVNYGMGSTDADTVVKLCKGLRQNLDAAAPQGPRRPVGWVNRYQRRYHGRYAFAIAFAALALSCGLFGADPGLEQTSGPTLALIGGGLGVGVLFTWAGVGLFMGVKFSTRRLRFALRVLQCLAVAGAVAMVAHGPPPSRRNSSPISDMASLVFGLLVGLGFFWYGVELWRSSLLRVRLGHWEGDR